MKSTVADPTSEPWSLCSRLIFRNFLKIDVRPALKINQEEQRLILVSFQEKDMGLTSNVSFHLEREAQHATITYCKLAQHFGATNLMTVPDRVLHEALIELMEHHVVREWLVSVVNVNQKLVVQDLLMVDGVAGVVLVAVQGHVVVEFSLQPVIATIPIQKMVVVYVLETED